MTTNEVITFLQGMVAADPDVGEMDVCFDWKLVGDFIVFEDQVHARVEAE